MSDGLMLETAFSPFTHSPSIRLANRAMPSSLSADHKWVGDGRPHVDPHRFGFEIFVERDRNQFRIARRVDGVRDDAARSEEHTPELQSLMRISSAVFCLKKTNTQTTSLPTITDKQTK